MSANTSTTEVGETLNHVDILEKIESQRAVGEYSPASSVTATRAPSLVDKLEEGQTPAQPSPITHRPTGFKVRPLTQNISDC